jgi:hypothetical protein
MAALGAAGGISAAFGTGGVVFAAIAIAGGSSGWFAAGPGFMTGRAASGEQDGCCADQCKE